MRIYVAHETVFHYNAPCTGVIQILRLTPRNHAGQYVVNWRIDVSADCRLEPTQDAFGNIVHALSLAGPVSELRLMVDGEVETQDTAGVVRSAVERFSPGLFLRETALTRPDAAILAYAARFLRPTAANTLSTLHNLLADIHQEFTAGGEKMSDAAATPAIAPAAPPPAPWAVPAAADAFKAGRGQSRDLAHIFISIARALGVPARFVAGYVRHGDEAFTQAEQTATNGAGSTAGDGMGNHWTGDCWAEAHLPGLGWIGFDPAGGVCPTDQYVRVAIGLDYLGATPVRGFHYGGVQEDVAVRLRVTQAARQTQE
jgi:transglutaminase-like putative cysteine protease